MSDPANEPKTQNPHAASSSVWDDISNDPDFHALKTAKRRFIIPATIFFMCFYMTLPILVGFFPDLMSQEVIGKVNWAYLFALSQFAMTWIVCGIYIRVARKWDLKIEALLAKYSN